MFQCITSKINCITECYIFYFYLLHCFTFSVKHLILSVIVIMFIHIRRICMHVLKVLRCFKHYFHVYIFKIKFQLFHEPSCVGSSSISFTEQVITPRCTASMIRFGQQWLNQTWPAIEKI